MLLKIELKNENEDVQLDIKPQHWNIILRPKSD